jgi:hypothetical protein
MVTDPHHYGEPIHVHFLDGYSPDGRAASERVDVLTDR